LVMTPASPASGGNRVTFFAVRRPRWVASAVQAITLTGVAGGAAAQPVLADYIVVVTFAGLAAPVVSGVTFLANVRAWAIRIAFGECAWPVVKVGVPARAGLT